MIRIHYQMLEARELCEDFLGQFVNFIVENVQNIREIIANDGDIRVVFDDKIRDLTDVILREKLDLVRFSITKN